MALSSVAITQTLHRHNAPSLPSRSKRVNRAGLVRCEVNGDRDSVILSRVERRPVLKAALGALTLAATPVSWFAWPEEAMAAGNAGAFDALVTDAVAQKVSAPVWKVLQTVLHDAATHDKEAKMGGLNGSLRFELDRPENASLKEVAAQVDAVKAMIDASSLTREPISWSDTLALVGLKKLSTEFKDHLCGVVKNGLCDQAYQAYGNKSPNARVGRVDATAADAEGLVPAPGASAAEYKALFARMGMTIPELCVLSPALTGDFDSSIALLQQDEQCAAALERLRKAKNDITRTSYEVPCFKAYIKMTSLGARFRKDAGLF